MNPFDNWLPAPVEPAVHLTGEEAAEWMQAIGWCPRKPVAGLRVAGDAIGGVDFALARLEHNSRHAAMTRPDVGVAVLSVDTGELRIRGEGMDETMHEGDVLLYPTPARFDIESEKPYGVVELSFEENRLYRFWEGLPERPVIVRAETTIARIVRPTIRTGLEARLDPDAPTWPLLRGVFEPLVSGLLVVIGPPIASGTTADTAELVRTAIGTITARRQEPDFDPQALADELDVPLADLEEAFVCTGRTPTQFLRAARVDSAREMLARRVLPSWHDQQELAVLAGFPTGKEMRRAIRLQDLEDAER
ncbi:AraC family transcriptional regulator [Rathayibacter tanaceti]|uniref:AraC family transcriptional regulator n=2 Tax=Rathayibacter tanaceti TaxID=1671680 RepID=A0A166HXV4_9MICO|nr:AraC family transcriptional regulator [Rathayibacter tanaceti]KZX21323.1 hypothetical protein ACH61_01556 [Rathayibacter tanaceti]QHC54286.1 AraC family transcriptional regulator [Rathayibacter tanaceti]TCO37964.1 hypothetical protein EV639_103151 [Rathayibacter tanaceti]